MAAPVVYDGASSGGTLFRGKKFWVAQRVPSRSRWVELLEANGGQIVHLEKLADILIADHLRKEVAPGSYSWRWIEESVKKGVLEDLEAHRAGPPVGVPRPVGSAHPTKNTRTPFTPADDRALALWVTKAEVRGLSTKGNDIYQQLELINPRHTYQSWRDRWLKYGQFRPRPELSSSPTVADPVPQQPSYTRTKALPNGSNPMSTAPITTTHLQEAKMLTQSVTPPVKPAQGNPFTEADGKRLLEIYDDILNIDESRLIEAWEKFAEEFPHHTAQEWYKFWIEDIKPLRAPTHRSSTKRQSHTQPIKLEKSESSRAVDVSTKDLSVSTQVEEDLQIRVETSRHSPTAKERFEHTITEFADAQNLELDLQPIINGRAVRLFDLWTIVIKSGFNRLDDEAIDKWGQIARDLGFENSLVPGASEELKDLYDWILADFVEARYDYRAYLKGILEGGRVLTEEQALDLEYLTPAGYEEEDQITRKHRQDENDGEGEIADIPSSPPERTLPFSKRLHSGTVDVSIEGTSSGTHEPTSHKRQRIDKGKEKVLEIPSTPEDLLTVAGQRRQSSSVQGNNLIHEQDGDDGMSGEDDELNMFVRPVARKIFPKTSLQASKTVQFEPETQDFHFSSTVETQSSTLPSQTAQEAYVAAGESVSSVAGALHEESSTQSQTDSQREAAEVQELVDHYVSLGYPIEIVQEAMLATTLETGDAPMVMEALIQGRGIPDNVEGVWTAEDDRAVRLHEKDEEYLRVVQKHTEARCIKRRQLLGQKEVLK